MQTVNPILANALDLLKQGNDELAEKEFAKAATACCEAFGEVRYHARYSTLCVLMIFVSSTLGLALPKLFTVLTAYDVCLILVARRACVSLCRMENRHGHWMSMGRKNGVISVM